jgi:hypothetical protein
VISLQRETKAHQGGCDPCDSSIAPITKNRPIAVTEVSY